MENTARLNKEELVNHFGTDMLTEENKATFSNKKEILEGKWLVVENFLNNVIFNKNFDLLPEYLHEKVMINSVSGAKGMGWETSLEGLNMWHNAFDVKKNETIKRFQVEDYVISHWTVTAFHKGDFAGITATNKEITFSGMTTYKVLDGKITSITGYSDFGR